MPFPCYLSCFVPAYWLGLPQNSAITFQFYQLQIYMEGDKYSAYCSITMTLRMTSTVDRPLTLNNYSDESSLVGDVCTMIQWFYSLWWYALNKLVFCGTHVMPAKAKRDGQMDKVILLWCYALLAPQKQYTMKLYSISNMWEGLQTNWEICRKQS